MKDIFLSILNCLLLISISNALITNKLEFSISNSGKNKNRKINIDEDDSYRTSYFIPKTIDASGEIIIRGIDCADINNCYQIQHPWSLYFDKRVKRSARIYPKASVLVWNRRNRNNNQIQVRRKSVGKMRFQQSQFSGSRSDGYEKKFNKFKRSLNDQSLLRQKRSLIKRQSSANKNKHKGRRMDKLRFNLSHSPGICVNLKNTNKTKMFRRSIYDKIRLRRSQTSIGPLLAWKKHNQNGQLNVRRQKIHDLRFEDRPIVRLGDKKTNDSRTRRSADVEESDLKDLTAKFLLEEQRMSNSWSEKIYEQNNTSTEKSSIEEGHDVTTRFYDNEGINKTSQIEDAEVANKINLIGDKKEANKIKQIGDEEVVNKTAEIGDKEIANKTALTLDEDVKKSVSKPAQEFVSSDKNMSDIIVNKTEHKSTKINWTESEISKLNETVFKSDSLMSISDALSDKSIINNTDIKSEETDSNPINNTYSKTYNLTYIHHSKEIKPNSSFDEESKLDTVSSINLQTQNATNVEQNYSTPKESKPGIQINSTIKATNLTHSKRPTKVKQVQVNPKMADWVFGHTQQLAVITVPLRNCPRGTKMRKGKCVKIY